MMKPADPGKCDDRPDFSGFERLEVTRMAATAVVDANAA